MRDVAVDTVFIGSCTNARIEDLRAAADGRRRAPRQGRGARPGRSRLDAVKAQAEAEGLDKIFIDAGFEWREPGCSMCLAMNPDKLRPASEPRPRPTATSRAGRAGAAARTSSPPLSPRRPPSPATSPPGELDDGARRVITGTAVPLDRSDVDTDQIIPAEWLKRVERTGFGEGLFSAWRDDRTFVLNDQRYGRVDPRGRPELRHGLVAEHAVWALMDYGFQAVVSPRFADIFRNNCTKAGLVPVRSSGRRWP